MARKTGGEVIRADRLEEFAKSLPQRQAPVMDTWSYPLWHTPWMFALALGCLISEWGLRRWKGNAVIRWAMLLAALACFLEPAETSSEAGPPYSLVVGAPGEPEYGTNFLRQAELWTLAAQKGGAQVTTIGVGGTDDLEALKNGLAAEPTHGVAELWLVLIGHGTFDGKEARFNLRGPDVAASRPGGMAQPITRQWWS